LIGIVPHPRLVSRTVPLRPGDTLVLYSDGLTDARTGDRRYGSEALLEFAGALAPTDAAAAVAAFAGLLDTFEELDDDVALMALSVDRPG
jgi:sigma-B regulation protein RsbU (phosphoserine phosphatase)